MLINIDKFIDDAMLIDIKSYQHMQIQQLESFQNLQICTEIVISNIQSNIEDVNDHLENGIYRARKEYEENKDASRNSFIKGVGTLIAVGAVVCTLGMATPVVAGIGVVFVASGSASAAFSFSNSGEAYSNMNKASMGEAHPASKNILRDDILGVSQEEYEQLNKGVDDLFAISGVALAGAVALSAIPVAGVVGPIVCKDLVEDHLIEVGLNFVHSVFGEEAYNYAIKGLNTYSDIGLGKSLLRPKSFNKYIKKGKYQNIPRFSIGKERKGKFENGKLVEIDGKKNKPSKADKTYIYPKNFDPNKKRISKRDAKKRVDEYLKKNDVKEISTYAKKSKEGTKVIEVKNIDGAGFEAYLPENTYILDDGKSFQSVITDNSELTAVVKKKNGKIHQITYYQYGCMAYQVDMATPPDDMGHWHKYDYTKKDEIFEMIKDENHYLGGYSE